MKYSMIPEFSDLQKALELAKLYNANFEYNDFTMPSVYMDPAEIDRRIEAYRALDRERSGDTMHGTFLGLDIAAIDPVIREQSRKLCALSMDIGERLGVKGVVFHTGLIGGLRLDYYLDNWLSQSVEFWTKQCSDHKGLTVYMENSFEQEPEIFTRLMKAMEGVPNFRLCLDYGHAILTPTPAETWIKELAPYIGHMHLNDNDLKDDLHLVPGMGRIDYVKWKHLMEEYHVETSVLLELNGYEKIEQSLKFMRTI